MDEMQDIIDEFLVESSELLDHFERDLVILEKDRNNPELLASIFRAIHTIKGSGGTLGFPKIAALAHAGESALSRMRDGLLLLTPEIATSLLATADALRTLLAQIKDNGAEGDLETSALLAQLSKHVAPAITAEGAHPSQNSVEVEGVPREGSSAEVCPSTLPSIPAGAAQAMPRVGELLMTMGVAAEQVHSALEAQHNGDQRKVGEILVANGAAEPGAVVEALRAQREAATESQASSTIRVDVGLLDKLMNRVGELVLARNQILQFTGSQQDSMFLNAAQRLNLITTELQESVMKTRMQPIGTVWHALPRVVRDLSLECHKSVEIEMIGADTELDKTIIEAIKGPLTHIVRNSLDHGIEIPEVRVARGKSPKGLLSLRAFHEGGQVIIEISDDGNGIRTESVKQKAIAKGKLREDEAARLSDRELLNLVFLPGLSTAEQVTNISGRGVGMDVVKTNIEKIGGNIDLQSVPGQGTTIRIKIPLTLAIIPALLVTSAGERFAIPQVSLVELVRVEPDNAERKIEYVHGSPVYRLRGHLLPLIHLNRVLNISATEASAQDGTNIVVLQAGERQIGLVVDEINDTEEIVVKPLSKQLKSLFCFAGATIMGDGRVALILDVMGLAQFTRIVNENHDAAQLVDTAAKDTTTKASARTWLVFRAGERGRMAIPLSAVARLEEFSSSVVEYSAGRRVIQYRGEVMPLYTVPEVLGQPSETLPELFQVIVHTEGGASIGLVVDEILDIVEQGVMPNTKERAGIFCGTAVIQQHVTDLFNLRVLRQHASSSPHEAIA
ncbi:MAG TPA: chemotaxis protein CheW [Candidatus Acidoferrales bacterium]|nr:chemotaxis protein CheW [Candidatus Acidoferrales bacterium]